MSTETDWEPKELVELLLWATQQGWEHDVLRYQDDYRFRAWRREGERAYVIWRNRVWTPSQCWFESPDVPGRMGHLSLAEMCTGLRWWEPTYDWSSMNDDQIVSYLKGKTFRWRNAYRPDKELDVTIPADYKKMTVNRPRNMRRPYVTFCISEYCSVFLDSITNIETAR